MFYGSDASLPPSLPHPQPSTAPPTPTAVRVAVSEQRRMQSDLTERIERLQEVQVRLEREAGELSRERDRLNLTLGAILEYQTFPVASWCPHRGEVGLILSSVVPQSVKGPSPGSPSWENLVAASLI